MASKVSKALPALTTVNCPEVGAVQVHQTEAPPELSAWVGSETSRVAKRVVPVALAVEPESWARAAKVSFAGTGGLA